MTPLEKLQAICDVAEIDAKKGDVVWTEAIKVFLETFSPLLVKAMLAELKISRIWADRHGLDFMSMDYQEAREALDEILKGLEG